MVMFEGDLKKAIKFYDKNSIVYQENGIYKPHIKNPEMKSTGEVMGISSNFAISFAKGQFASGNILPKKGTVFISLSDIDKEFASVLGHGFINLGFNIVATSGTHKALNDKNVEAEFVYKISEGRPNIQDSMKNNEIALVVNTSDSKSSKSDAKDIRRTVIKLNIPYFTTIAAAKVAIESIKELNNNDNIFVPKALQDYLG